MLAITWLGQVKSGGEESGEESGGGAHLVGLAILDVPLPVKEPVGNLVLAGVLREGESSHTYRFNSFWLEISIRI